MDEEEADEVERKRWRRRRRRYGPAGEDYLISFSLFFTSAAAAAAAVGRTGTRRVRARKPEGNGSAGRAARGEGPKGHCSSNLYE